LHCRRIPVCEVVAVRTATAFKGLGYSVSTLSVLLLGIVAWRSAADRPLLFLCLLLGMASSILGMTLRWLSHRIEQKEKDRIEAKAEAPSPAGPAAAARGG
jgi:hypothetical protein